MNKGFSLIGVLVSLFFLVSAGIMIAQVISRTKDAASRSRQVFIATHLAREGSELVQAIRDTNWFVGRQEDDREWTADLCDTGDTNHELALDAAGVRGEELVTYGEAESQLYQTEDGEWTHNPSGATATPYSRVISIDCASKDGESIDDPGRIQVTSTVTWTQGEEEQSVITRSVLYNWLRLPE